MNALRYVAVAIIAVPLMLPVLIGGFSFLAVNNLQNGRPIAENPFFQSGVGVTPVASFKSEQFDDGVTVEIGWQHNRYAVWGISLYAEAEGAYVFRAMNANRPQLGFYRHLSDEQAARMADAAGITLAPPSFLSRMGAGIALGLLLILGLVLKVIRDNRPAPKRTQTRRRRL